MFKIGKDSKFLQGAIDALTSHIAILDREGNIINVNKAWREFAEINAYIGRNFGIGTNYIESCAPSVGQPQNCDSDGNKAAQGVLDVINGKSGSFEMEYPCHSPTEQRWFVMRITRFGEGEKLNVVVAHENVTKRKIAELALRESEESYRILAETASDAIIRIDENSRIQFINRAGEKVFGYRVEKMIGQSLTMLMPENLREAHLKGFERYLETGERHLNWKNLELPAQRGDGHIFPIEVSFSEYKRDEKHFFIGVARDISERKRSEAALRESENSLRTLADSVPQLVWMAEPDGFIFWYNERWYEYTGTTPKDMEGWGWQAVHDPEILPKVIERWKRSIETGEIFEMEFPLRGADGVFRWFLTRVVPLRDAENRIVRWFGTNTDVNESRQMRDDLRESESRFRAMTNNAPMLVWMSGADKLCTYFNKTWLDFTGRTMEQELGNGWAEGVHPEDYERCLEIYATSFDARKEFEMEYRLRRCDGEYRWVLDCGVPLFTPEGVFKGYIGSCVDVTERKQAEQEREEILRREHAARIQAEAANRAKDEFLSVLSHELRTPLNSVLGWTKMLRAGMLDENRAAQAYEVIERNAKLQNNLIEDLLDVSRIITGKMRIEPEPVDFVSIINTTLEAARPSAEAKNITLEFHSENNSQMIFGDANRLQQVVSNLVNNAVKFTPQNGGVSLTLRRVNGKIRLETRDTGIGISKEFLSTIFDRFKQVDSTTRRAHSGLGLGLTIVRHLTELHGGTVEAFSDGEGSGATFVVELPLYVESVSENGEKVSEIFSQIDESLTGARVLMVDDDCDGLMPLQIFLELQRAEVECVTSAQAALSKLSEKTYDILISDIGMPETDGYELMTKLRQTSNGRNSCLPAIALTAYASTQDRRRALAAGYQAHLAKPVDFEELLSAVKKLIRRAVND